ncbi:MULTISPECIES: hypothetical protein [Limnobaculum]|uniref:hypothetical protein n=1 Tax=Limnobaculum TaxID=2172100 RepID=UPI001E47702D|nr:MULTISPECIES: hypothetical protein [Limnobaculum]
MATDEQKLLVLDMIIKNQDTIAWRFLYAQISSFNHLYMENARPKWRDDDAGSAQMRGTFFAAYYSDLGERILTLAEGNTERLAGLIKHIDHFEGSYQTRLIHLVKQAISFPDEEKEIIREALCHYLHWHNSYNTSGDKKSRATAELLAPLFNLLSPKDIILDKRRLFTHHYPDLPEGDDKDYIKRSERIKNLRIEAIEEIYSIQGWSGISSLLISVQSSSAIGDTLAFSSISYIDSFSWIIEKFSEDDFPFHYQLISSFYNWLPTEKQQALINSSILNNEINNDVKIAAFFSALPLNMTTWKILLKYTESARTLYWKKISHQNFWIDNDDEADYFIDKMISVGRYISAFNLVKHHLEKVSWQNILKLLNGFRNTTEKDVPLPNGWYLSKAIEYLELSGKVSRLDLALQEFFFFSAFRNSEKEAKNLYAELLSNPPLFIQLVSLAYKPTSDPNYKLDESLHSAAQQAHRILDHSNGLPGQEEDNDINESLFHHWIHEVRKLAMENDRCDITDYLIGKWLATSQYQNDDLWPCSFVRHLLEETENDSIREGFYFGIISNRGVTMRGYHEGGDKERKLVDKYREIANKLYFSYPKVASIFDELMSYYNFDAINEDQNAKLRTEGY